MTFFNDPRNMAIAGLSITVLLLAYYIYSREEYGRPRISLAPTPATPRSGPTVVVAGDASRREEPRPGPTRGITIKTVDGKMTTMR